MPASASAKGVRADRGRWWDSEEKLNRQEPPTDYLSDFLVIS
jgi:hypothetical protein